MGTPKPTQPTYTHRHNATGARAYVLATTTDGLLLMRHEHEGDTHRLPAAELDVLYTAAEKLCIQCRTKARAHLKWCEECTRQNITTLFLLADIFDEQDRREAIAE